MRFEVLAAVTMKMWHSGVWSTFADVTEKHTSVIFTVISKQIIMVFRNSNTVCLHFHLFCLHLRKSLYLLWLIIDIQQPVINPKTLGFCLTCCTICSWNRQTEVLYLATMSIAQEVEDERNTSVEHWWGDTDRESLSQCQFVYHKSRVDWPRIEPATSRRQAGD